MLRASAFEYRYRFVVHALIYALGFFAPWNYGLHLDPPGPNAHVWGLLAANLARVGLGNISSAFNMLLCVAIACAVAGAWLRTWGSAYLGANVVQSGAMHTAAASGMLQDGPFRFMRNPLYLGTFLHTLALSLLMPRSGAIFTIVAVGIVQVRLILAEEPFLLAKLGAPYAAYCSLVPRVWPAFVPKVAATGLQARWGQAVMGEIYMWGVAGCFAVAGWWYDAGLLTQCVVVALGVSMVVRAVVGSSLGEKQSSAG